MISNLNIINILLLCTILICSGAVICMSNPVHSVLFLVLVFCNTTILLLLSGVEFLSIMLIIIYVGAIAILFLFVIMMLDILIYSNNGSGSFIICCSFIALALLLETYSSCFYLLNCDNLKLFSEYLIWGKMFDLLLNTNTLGQTLYTFFSQYFLTSGIILLVPLIGAVVLTLKQNNKKPIDTFKQISRLKDNSIFNVYEKNKK